MIKNYKDLIVWQKSMDLVELIYQYLEEFPKKEEFCLSDQIRRSAISVPSNIAEGYGRNYRQDYKRFLCISRGSLYELQTQIEIAHRLKYLNDKENNLQDSLTEIEKMLNSLLNKL